MIDPTPDSVYLDGECVESYPEGICLVRDNTHDYKNPSYLAKFDLNASGGFAALRLYLQNDVRNAKPVYVIREAFPERMTIDQVVIGNRYRLKRELFLSEFRKEASITLAKGLDLVAEKKNTSLIGDNTVTLSFADGKVKIKLIPNDLETVS
jgi:hypothetical protein